MRRVFVINPTAGKSNAAKWLVPKIRAAAAQTGLPAEIVITTHAGPARPLAAQAAAEGREIRVYACGRDGTMN